MTCLPAVNSEELATQSETVRQETREESATLRQEMRVLRDEMRNEIATSRREIHTRLDRVFLAQIAATIAVGTANLAT